LEAAGKLFESPVVAFHMTDIDIDRIIEMAWEDRTPFEAIHIQFGLSESQVIDLMRRQLKRKSFLLWRARVNSGVSQKHAKKRNPEIDRFKCTRQRQISMNKISKR
jgi:uncharacterized protein (TIGR03643 family)